MDLAYLTAVAVLLAVTLGLVAACAALERRK
jgi:hypothetical protein